MSSPFPIETTVEYEEVFCFDCLDIMATFRVEVEQMPGRPWRIGRIEGKNQDGSWAALPYGSHFERAFRLYARDVYPQAIVEALIEAQDAALEASRSDAGDVRREMVDA